MVVGRGDEEVNSEWWSEEVNSEWWSEEVNSGGVSMWHRHCGRIRTITTA